MRLLFTFHTGASHLRVLTPLAEAAVRAGHQVLFASTESMRATVENLGFAFRAVGREWRDYTELNQELGLLLWRDDVAGYERFMVEKFYTGEPVEPAARDLIALAGHWRPDVVVREGEDLAGYLAAEAVGVPHVCIASGTTHELSAPQIVPALNRLRERLGLPPEPDGGGCYRYLLANLVPDSYVDEVLSGPASRSYRPSTPAEVTGNLPAWINDLDPARPLVFASLGTVASTLPFKVDRTLTSIIEALSRMECSAVVSVGLGRDLAEFATPPEHVHLVNEWIPQELMLASCDLFVTHAGFGSVREAMRAGTPMVMTPMWDDQIYHAERCAGLGLGEVLRRRRRRPSDVRALCEQVLAGGQYRTRARAVQREFLTLPPVAKLLEDVVALATRARPVTGVAR